MTEREKKSSTWWRGETEAERFLLYYTCLRFHYEMAANEALATAKANWASFGPRGDLVATIRSAVSGAR
jgi:hypothetical protein